EGYLTFHRSLRSSPAKEDGFVFGFLQIAHKPVFGFQQIHVAASNIAVPETFLNLADDKAQPAFVERSGGFRLEIFQFPHRHGMLDARSFRHSREARFTRGRGWNADSGPAIDLLPDNEN